MSKCDLRIVFDRADRTYRSGEEVAGNIHVRVNRDVKCDGLLLEHFWQTHGRGNRDTGGKQSTVLFRGNWRAGESLSYPFRFHAPDGPQTYHGNYLNIDHYVNVRVDIPWALDSKLKEEYILQARPEAYGHFSPGGRLQHQQIKAGFEKFGVPIGIAMLVLGVAFLFPVGCILIPGGIIVLFFALRRILAEQKIGKVNLLWSSLSVAPGGRLPVVVSFTPRQSSRLNGITASLVGKEVCTSGSGTNRTTHTYKLCERTVTLAASGNVTAGQPIRIECRIPIPQTNAYSFSASNNKIVWEVEIRIDIPTWPDWLQKKTITVRPDQSETFPAIVPVPPVPDSMPRVDELRSEQAVPEQAVPEQAVPEQAAPEPPAQQPAEPEASIPPQPPHPEPEEAPSGDTLTDVVERLAAANRYSRQREQIIAEQADRTFDCEIEVARVERTFGLTSEDRFRDGRTITGKVAGTDCNVSLRLSAERNEELDAVAPGDTFRTTCVLSKWNAIYEQLDMRQP